MPAGCDSAALLPAAEAAGVSYMPGARFYAGGGGARYLRLAFSLLGAEELAEGTRRLGAGLRAATEGQTTLSLKQKTEAGNPESRLCEASFRTLRAKFLYREQGLNRQGAKFAKTGSFFLALLASSRFLFPCLVPACPG